jgi:hypothetical protein
MRAAFLADDTITASIAGRTVMTALFASTQGLEGRLKLALGPTKNADAQLCEQCRNDGKDEQ